MSKPKKNPKEDGIQKGPLASLLPPLSIVVPIMKVA